MSMKHSPSRPDGLTPQEFRMAVALSLGMTTKEASEAIGCNHKTGDTHRMHLITKLKLRNNSELVHHAIRHGWIVVDAEGVRECK